jgi:hypothetical protein
MRLHSVAMWPQHHRHQHRRRLTHTRMPLLLQVQAPRRYLHKPVRSLRLLLVLMVGLHHRSTNSRTRLLRRRPPARPVFPRPEVRKVLEVSILACLRLVKDLLPLSTVSLITLI